MTNITHLYGETFIGELIELRTPSGNRYRFQNFSPGDNYEYKGKVYQWLPFIVENFSEQLELNSETLEIKVVNTSLVRDFLQQEGDIRRSILIYSVIFPESPNAPEDVERTQISTYSLSKSVIMIGCASPVLALNNKIPTKVFDPKTFPALPFFNKPEIQSSRKL